MYQADAAASGEFEFAVVQVLRDEGDQLVQVLGKHPVLGWVGLR